MARLLSDYLLHGYQTITMNKLQINKLPRFLSKKKIGQLQPNKIG